MVVNEGNWKCRPTFSWAVGLLVIGSCLIAIISADSVVIHAQREAVDNTVSGVVRRQGLSLENCADACAKETQIRCKFFKFLNDTGTCLLSSTNNPDINRLAVQSLGVLPDAETPDEEKALTTWIKDLEQKVETFEDQESDVENLKTAIGDIRDELKMLRKGRISESHRAKAVKVAQQMAYAQLTRKLVGLKVDGERFKAAVHALSNMQRVLAKEIGDMKDDQKDVLLKMSELEKAGGDMNSLVSTFKAADGSTQRELDSIKEGANDLASKFSKLKDQVFQEIANKEMPSGMVKLKHNQGALATALESMTERVNSLMGRLPSLEKELRGTNQKVTNQAMYEQELQSKLKILYQNLITLKKAVHDLLDPRSAVNLERAKGVLKLKSDVSMLAEMDKGLKSELQDQREDMGRLVKDVARVQLMAHNLKDKLTLLLTASRQFQQDIFLLKAAQKNGLSVVEVAQMQKQVLVALNRLKTREAILLKQLNKYRASVKTVAKRVTDTSNKKTHTHHMLLRLQYRLNRSEKQLKLLLDKAKALTARHWKPKQPKGITDLLSSQTRIDDNVKRFLQQLRSLRKKVNILTLDLQETKKAAENEKKEMGLKVKEEEKEIAQKEREQRRQAKKDEQETEKALKYKKKMLNINRKKMWDRLKSRLQEEKKKSKALQKKPGRLKQKKKAKRKKQKKHKKEEKRKGRKRKKQKDKKRGKKRRPGKTKKQRKTAELKRTQKPEGKISQTRQQLKSDETIVISDNAKNAKNAIIAVGVAEKQASETGKGRKKGKGTVRSKGRGKSKVRGKGKKKGKGKVRTKGKRKGKGKVRGKGKKKGKVRNKGNGKVRGKGKKKHKVRGKGRKKGKGKVRGKGKKKGKVKGKSKKKGRVRDKSKKKGKVRGKGKKKGKVRGKGKKKGRVRGKSKKKGKVRGKGKKKGKVRGKGKKKGRVRGKGKKKGKVRGKGKKKGKVRGKGKKKGGVRGKGKKKGRVRGKGKKKGRVRGKGKKKGKVRGKGKKKGKVRSKGKKKGKVRNKGKKKGKVRGKGEKRGKGKVRGKGKKKGKVRGKGKQKGKSKVRGKGKKKGKGKLRSKGKKKGKVRGKGKMKGKGKVRGKGKKKGKVRGKGKKKGKVRSNGKKKGKVRGKDKKKGKVRGKDKKKGKGKVRGKDKKKGKVRGKDKKKGKGKVRGKDKKKGKVRGKGEKKGKGKIRGKGKKKGKTRGKGKKVGKVRGKGKQKGKVRGKGKKKGKTRSKGKQKGKVRGRNKMKGNRNWKRKGWRKGKGKGKSKKAKTETVTEKTKEIRVKHLKTIVEKGDSTD